MNSPSSKTEILNMMIKTIFGSECGKGNLTENNKGVTFQGSLLFLVRTTEAVLHVDDGLRSYLAWEAF